MLLGVRAVIAESFERIHRSNLIGMGVLPLQFKDGDNAADPRAYRQGNLRYRRTGSRRGQDGAPWWRTAKAARPREFQARLRIDTPKELDYFRHGGILHYVLRQLAAARRPPSPKRLTPAAAAAAAAAPHRGGGGSSLPLAGAATPPASTSTMVDGSRWVRIARLTSSRDMARTAPRTASQPAQVVAALDGGQYGGRQSTGGRESRRNIRR